MQILAEHGQGCSAFLPFIDGNCRWLLRYVLNSNELLPNL